MASQSLPPPSIDRSVSLDLVGDWGQATFHKINSWLTQQFCDHAGPKSRTRIWSVRGGGAEAIPMVHDGEVDMCVATPAKLMGAALEGEGIFARYGPMPHLRALGTLPQRDRMILIVHPKFGVHSYEEIRYKKPPFKLASSENDGESFIGYVALTLLAAHGLEKSTLESWGGRVLASRRPQQCIQDALDGTADALIQEAIMLPEWDELVGQRGWIPIPIERQVVDDLGKVQGKAGFEPADLTSFHWDSLKTSIQALDLADFLLVVGDDMPHDVAALLTWCLIHTRTQFEAQFKHIPRNKCALTYPMDPVEMAKTSIPLHPAAKKIYQEAGYLS